MSKIKVLVVDDSVVIRKLVSDALSQDPAIEVVGIAANGKIALQKIPHLEPDVITLDVEMPELNGLETLEELRKQKNKIPVIMFSTLTERGAKATLDALSLGAADYVAKPSGTSGALGAMEQIKIHLTPKIKALVNGKNHVPEPVPETKPVQKEVKAKPPSTPVKLVPEKKGGRIDIVAIGVSTGGPNALAELMPVFPKDFPVPIVLVQHMPPHFTRLLSERLNGKSNLEILENKPGTDVIPGRAIIAAGDYHMTIQRKGTQVVTQANQEEPENSCRPAVDVLFRSIPPVYGPNVLAVILTGMGQDGMLGCKAILAKGGRIFAQDEESSVVWGMPGFVVKNQLAEKIYRLDEMGFGIIQAVESGR